MTDLRRERVEIRNPKRDKLQVLPSSEVTVTTWSPEQMDAHLAKIGGGKAMQKEAVLTKEKLQDLTSQGFTAKEIADQTGKTVGTVNNYKYKWGVKKQLALEEDHDPEEMEDVQEAVVAPDFHEEKERHLKADIKRLKSENDQVRNERDNYKQAFDELKSDFDVQEEKAHFRFTNMERELSIEAEKERERADDAEKKNHELQQQLNEMERLQETDMQLLPDDAYTEYQTLYEQTAALLKMHLPG